MNCISTHTHRAKSNSASTGWSEPIKTTDKKNQLVSLEAAGQHSCSHSCHHSPPIWSPLLFLLPLTHSNKAANHSNWHHADQLLDPQLQLNRWTHATCCLCVTFQKWIRSEKSPKKKNKNPHISGANQIVISQSCCEVIYCSFIRFSFIESWKSAPFQALRNVFIWFVEKLLLFIMLCLKSGQQYVCESTVWSLNPVYPIKILFSAFKNARFTPCRQRAGQAESFHIIVRQKLTISSN